MLSPSPIELVDLSEAMDLCVTASLQLSVTVARSCRQQTDSEYMKLACILHPQ